MEGNLLGIPGMTPGGLGIWGILLYVVGWSLNQYRETRKLSDSDRQARREGFAKQVDSLMVENRLLREELSDAHTRHEDSRQACHAETDQLRRTVMHLEDMVAGFRRQLAAIGSTALEQVSDAGVIVPPLVRAIVDEAGRDLPLPKKE